MREVAYHHIQRKISSRELRAGAPVSDVGIAKELGISRTPAREAIHQLVSEGLLESSAGRGVVVITLDRDDIRELYEMREALEGLAARTVAARPPSASEMRDFRLIAAAMTSLVKELETSRKPALDEKQMERFEVADLAFHTYLMKLARESKKPEGGFRYPAADSNFCGPAQRPQPCGPQTNQPGSYGPDRRYQERRSGSSGTVRLPACFEAAGRAVWRSSTSASAKRLFRRT